MKTARKHTNAERIVRKALQMYNKDGVQAVTNRDIAKALNISSGNLTYHFNKKVEIVDRLVDMMFRELTEIMKEVPNPSDNMTEQQARSMLELLRVFWRYRFFFNSIRYLTQVDRSQKAHFNRLRETLVDYSVDAYEKLIELDVVKPVDPPSSVRLLVENTWYLWFSLIRLYEIVAPTPRLSERGFYRFSFAHLYALLEPHYSDSVKVGFYEYLQSELG